MLLIRSSSGCVRGWSLGKRWKRRGTAIVEFALLSPFLFLLVLGLIEFGRVLMVEQILTNGAREACRTASMPGSASGDVQNTAVNYLTNSSIPVSNPSSQISVSPDPATATPGTAMTVTVNVPFSNVSWLPTPLFMGGKTLSASVVMRKESNSN
jgi:Flp pilus assembly protein TadG